MVIQSDPRTTSKRPSCVMLVLNLGGGEANTHIKIRAILDDVRIGREIIVINPDTSSVLDCDAIIVKNTSDSQISDNDI